MGHFASMKTSLTYITSKEISTDSYNNDTRLLNILYIDLSILVIQVELVLELEETVAESFAKRARVKRHVEHPNKDRSKVVLFNL